MLLILALCSITSSFSQVRYYNWGNTVLNSSAPQYTTGDMISVKKYIFYTHSVKATTYLYRIDSSGTCVLVSYSLAKPLPTTNFCYSSTLNRLFFVDINHKVKELNPDTLTTIYDVFGAVSARGDGLVFGEGTNELYFVRTDGKIYRSLWTGTWTTQTINQSGITPPKTGSRFVYHGWKLIYTDTYSKLRMLYYDSLAQPPRWDNWLVNQNAPDARGDCLIQGEFDELFYALKDSNNIYNDGRIVHTHWNEAADPPSFDFEVIDYPEPALSGSNFSYGDNALFYVNKNRILNVLAWQPNNCVWTNEHLNIDFLNYSARTITYGNS